MIQIYNEVCFKYAGSVCGVGPLFQAGKVGFDNCCSSSADSFHSVVKGGDFHGSSVINVGIDANTGAVESRKVASADIVRQGAVIRDGKRVVIVRVDTRHSLQEVCCILDCPGHRANGVLMFADGNDEVPRRQTYTGLNTN